MPRFLKPLVLPKKIPTPVIVDLPKPQVEVRNVFSLRKHPKQELYFPAVAATDLKALTEDILANGLTEKIEVMPDGTTISGHRRTSALIRLVSDGHSEFEEIEMIVRYDLVATGPQAVERRLLQANCNRRHLSVMEQARMMDAMFKLDGVDQNSRGKSIANVAGVCGVSSKTVERGLALLNLPLELQRLVDTKKLTQQLAMRLLTFATKEEIETLRHLAVAGGDVKKAAGSVLAKHVTVGQRKPDPRKLLKAFLKSSDEARCFLKEVMQTIQDDSDECLKMQDCLHGVKCAMLVATECLKLIQSASNLSQEILDKKVTANPGTLEEAITTAQADLKRPVVFTSSRKLTPLEYLRQLKQARSA